mgnify:CR=1 FL=1
MKKASLVGAFFVGAIWLTAAEAFCPAPKGLLPATVLRVVDGDTLHLKAVSYTHLTLPTKA